MNQQLLLLFQIEKELRQSDSINGLNFVIVNRLRGLVGYDQAALFLYDGADASKKLNLSMISDVPQVDKNTPFNRWLLSAAKHTVSSNRHSQTHFITQQLLPKKAQAEWQEWGSPCVIWLPLIKGEQPIGGLWISRNKPFSEEEVALFEKVVEVGAHALWSLHCARPKRWGVFSNKKWAMLSSAIACAAMFIPVQQTVLAPAHVIPQSPAAIAAPMNGVISKVSVEPNSIVKAGDMLLQYDDTELSGQLLIANEQVLLAQAELLNTRQAAFSDQQEKAKIALLQNRIAIKESERDFIANQTSRINVIAPNDGVVIFNDQSDLVGLPVKTGQRLMQIAQPYNTRLQIDLPVADGLVFPPDTPVKLFLDKSPLTAIEARLIYSDYEPDVTPAGVLSYRLVAQFTGSDLPRLGLHGSAKLIGDEVSLFYYLFRRPMAALRQTIGF